MRTVNMTAGNDNEIIWLLKINVEGTEYRFATETTVLSSNTWDGEALGINDSRFSFNEFGKRVNIIGDGTLGEVATVTFSFSRYVSSTLLSDFFNEFYPATSGKILVSSFIEIGLVWRGSDDEDDITWLQKYNIEDYSYDEAQISLISSEFSEFENFALPYYKIQKDYDDNISFYEDAPEENYGLSIPIVYGSHSITHPGDDDVMDDPEPYKFVSVVPLICVNKNQFIFKASSHKIKGFNYIPYKIYLGGSTNNNTIPDIFRHIPELDVFANMYAYDVTNVEVKNIAVNNLSGATIELDTNYPILGDVCFYMDKAIENSDYMNIKEIIDYREDTYIDLQSGENLYVNIQRLDDRPPTFGELDGATDKTRIYALVENPTANTCSVRLQNYDGVSTNFSDFNVNASETRLLGHTAAGLNFDSWEAINDNEYGVLNTDASDNIYIKKVYFYVHTFAVTGFTQKITGTVIMHYAKAR